MNNFKLFYESSLNQLYQSAVSAFPETTKRQHATQPIRITGMNWTPFIGLNTLLIRGNAQNEGREYRPLILFKNVRYGSGIPIMASDGRTFEIQELSSENTNVLLRCNCQDHRFRFGYYNHLDKSLFGKVPAKYESKGIGPSANPLKLPGMCKHLMRLAEAIRDSGVLK